MTRDDIVPNVGRRLAAARMRRGQSQATVARRAGLAASYLSRIENGRVQPTFRTVMRLARALRVDAAELTGPEVPDGAARGPCPVSARGGCLLDLIRPEDAGAHPDVETYTPRQVRLLRRLASWMRAAPPDRLRAMEILLEDLTRDGGA